MVTAIAEPPHLETDLKTLCLSTVATQWRPLAEQASRQRQAPADYLAQLVHLEVTGRRERRIQRRIQDARFPMLKTLDAFSFDAQPDLDRDAVLHVFDCRFVADAANVVFVGGVGTGKTHLSIALGMACCQHDYRVRFVTAAELVTLLVEAQQQGRLQRKLDQLARYDAVILDELGYVPFDKAGADLLFGFISQRYERWSLVVTTNLPFARWAEVFLDATAAAAVIDRIVHHATVLTTAGDSSGSKPPHATRRPARQRRCHGNSAHRDVASRRSAPSGHVAMTTTTQEWGSHFTWPQRSLFQLPFPRYALQEAVGGHAEVERGVGGLFDDGGTVLLGEPEDAEDAAATGGPVVTVDVVADGGDRRVGPLGGRQQGEGLQRGAGGPVLVGDPMPAPRRAQVLAEELAGAGVGQTSEN